MGEKRFFLIMLTIALLGLGTQAGAGSDVYAETKTCLETEFCRGKGLFVPGSATLKEKIMDTFENVFYDVKSDLEFYFERDNLLALGGVLAFAGLISNTDVDSSFRHFWQDVIRSKFINSLLKFPCKAGDFSYRPYYKASILLGGLFFDECTPDAPLTVLYNWGYRSLRTLYLAGAQKELFTWVIGNGRPNAHTSSKWHPCKKGASKKSNKNHSGVGVSAHAFNGAIPFLTAAMMTDEPILKYSLYIFSTLPGLARVNDDHHYFSQVFLGWAISFLSAKAIDKTERSCYPIKFHILPVPRGGKLCASVVF